ncbi:hypothetical protein APA22_20320 [Acetobacter pasteurianus IFO 3283-22]|uniref:Uncharacterized protein n=1 Tax=Acetobacter pasteurianus (strain NBRC 105184 / IFO 3283-01) TaxID=634452 RepID=C7JDE2_ACEP3|nr:hypothetical protein APA01_20320 [Acetobacter pasteurianus IFO 3283-01]BAI03207.1 hypothetical protein APA03_20320 [Acetobacter pasteurianus IFO 3283-03]BAI06252.1 hypothetical protein APA07_20320 [Acetobacter pasteurianus IFO 3283-07]BAI09302.1 hypothetical protein APA22_20320 [Acetobacter pasteurianus IFO 3283-22]BAI12350.1 hypothetical protein APA26_20320 [Acetobacter pasteurianus IFO 3283-26]BAI15396.1 hypothetical protein APA32_20320 [Acetobacter pasteurianus IFO 3283-32]BAI18375.1 hy
MSHKNTHHNPWWRKTVSNTRYKIEEADGGFVLVEERTGPFPKEIRVPYSIAQEAESGTDAASRNGDALRDQRKQAALSLARYAASFFIEKDPDAHHLLRIRERVEKLLTASIAELRKNAAVPSQQTE